MSTYCFFRFLLLINLLTIGIIGAVVRKTSPSRSQETKAQSVKIEPFWYAEFELPFWVYILQSLNTERFYCGHTSDLQRRINQHNDPEYQLSRTTKVFQGPWATRPELVDRSCRRATTQSITLRDREPCLPGSIFLG